MEGALSSTKKPLCHINQVRFVAMNGTRRKNIKNRFVSAFICCSRLSSKGESGKKGEFLKDGRTSREKTQKNSRELLYFSSKKVFRQISCARNLSMSKPAASPAISDFLHCSSLPEHASRHIITEPIPGTGKPTVTGMRGSGRRPAAPH